MSHVDNIRLILRNAQSVTLYASETATTPLGSAQLAEIRANGDVVLDVAESWILTQVLKPGDKVSLRVGAQGSLWEMTAAVVGPDLRAPNRILVTWPEGAEQIQRRDHFRVDARLACKVGIQQSDGGVQELSTQTQDLSAGGVRLEMPEVIARGTLVRIALSLPEMGTYFVEGTIAASGEKDGAAWAGVKFTKLDPTTQRAITRFVSAEELKRLRSR